MLTLLFVGILPLASIQQVKASGTIYIKADGSVDPPIANITSVDNVTYYFTDNNYDGIVVERDNIVVDGANYTLQGTGGGRGIDLSGRSNVTVQNTTIKAFDYGIYLLGGSYNTISGTNITAINWFAIYLIDSSYNAISENNINENNWDALLLHQSSNYNTIFGNNITANKKNALLLDGSSNFNVVSGNNLASNHWRGIGFTGSNYNTVSGNNITNNKIGIEIRRFSGIYSSRNKIYHNNFVDNSEQVFGDGPANFWDDGYPSGGNYWSDYTDVDSYSGPYQNETDSDNIWDHPYVIDDHNQDDYPLTKPWGEEERALLGAGWGWMRIALKEYVFGSAELYRIGDEQIELVVTYHSSEYSRAWNIMFHRQYQLGEIYLCCSKEWGFLIVGLIEHRRGHFWLAVGKCVVAFGLRINA